MQKNRRPSPASIPLAFALAGLLVVPALGLPVISWVAPYKVEASKAMLQRDFGGVGMKDGLTWLALQFWITDGPGLTQDANVAGANFDAHVKWFRDWGRQNGVKVTLCVTNYVGGWNWPEARRSFNDNRAAFVAALVAEVDRLELDGVELDMEGLVVPLGTDISGFLAFSRDLAAALHAKGKDLTVASFPAQWNAPNWTWWRELMKSVDAVTSMSYEEAGKGSTHGFDYAEQKKKADPPHKLMIGMPGYKGEWQGHGVVDQLDWVVADGTVGVGIWESSLPDPAWQTAEVWQRLAKIRNTLPVATRATLAPLRRGDSNGDVFDIKGGRAKAGLLETPAARGAGVLFIRSEGGKARKVLRLE